MSYNFNEIRNALIDNVKYAFDNSQFPQFHDFEHNFDFDKGLEIFLQTIIYKCGVHELDGLTKTIIPALHEAFITNKGELAPLKLLASELEAYLKKIAFIISNGSNNYSNDRSKTMVPLLKQLNLNPTNAWLDYNYLNTYRGANDFLEYVCLAYITRNEVHQSPNWRFSEVSINLEAVIITYLYATFKHASTLKTQVGTISIPVIHEEDNSLNKDQSLKALYDFISYNNGTVQFKTQIISSYILHQLSTYGKMTIDKISEACNLQFETNAHQSFYKNLLNDLAKPEVAKVILSGVFNNEVVLSEKEQERIKKVKEDYAFNEQFLLLEVSELLKLFSLQGKEIEILEHLKYLFELYYNIDIDEIHDRGFEAKTNLSNLKDFVDYLKALTGSESKAENLFKELILICKGNDFLYKITAGQVFARITNPEFIEQYTRQHQRTIYLDANVLLYALCYYYESVDDYDNSSYNSIKDLLDFAEKDNNIKLFTINQYVLETAYQLKEALLLIPFDEAGIFSKIGGSNNVFYNYYKFLKLNNNLEDMTFLDFMEGFELYEDDLYSRNFLHTTSGLIDDMLYNIGVDVVETPNYNLENAYEIVKNTLTMALKFKDEEPMKNDAAIVSYLSDKDAHTTEPTFVTLDNSFYEIRKKYLSKNRSSQKWHLFTPSKMVNHLYLFQFRVNSKSISNDYISLIDGLNLYENTKQLMDFTGNLFDINKETKRKYVTKFKEWNSEFVYNINEKVEKTDDSSKPVKPTEKLIIELNRYYAGDRIRHNFGDLKRLLDKDEYFDKVVKIFTNELQNYSFESKFKKNTFSELDKLIDEVKLGK